MEERIQKAIDAALAKAGSSEYVPPMVERPENLAHGDYATNVAMVAAKSLGRNPKELAGEIAEHIKSELGDAVAQVEVAGPGFINITLARSMVSLLVAEADAKGSEWGRGSGKNGLRVLIEYTDPNPFKEMHIGHLMSNVIGESIARLTEQEGAKIVRANYQGDVGPHVAKALWGLARAGITEPTSARELGEAYAAGSRAYEESEAVKAEIDAINQAIYAGTDATLIEQWRNGRDVSLAAFEALYKRLGTHFDYYFFESETAAIGMRLVQDGVSQGVFEESDGAIIYRGEKKGLHTLVFITSRGTPTYEAKDIGLAFLKEERVHSDESIIVTAAEQIGHFKVVFAALEELAPLIAAKTKHVPHGFLRLTTGKMSSREGNVITAAELIASISEKASEKNPDPLIAEQVALGAIKYMVLRQTPGSDIVFDPEKSLSLEGDSGPYLQYALVRAKSVLQKAENSTQKTVHSPDKPYDIERMIMHFPEVVARASRELSPNILSAYLIELASAWNSFYAKEQIIGSDHESHKLMIARAFVNTMTSGLTLLAIPIPEKM